MARFLAGDTEVDHLDYLRNLLSLPKDSLVRLVEEMPDDKDAYLTAIVGLIAEEDPYHALEIVAGMGEDYGWLRYGVFPVWSVRDPEAAFAYYMEHIADRGALSDFVSPNAVFRSLAVRHPNRALAAYLDSRQLNSREEEHFLDGLTDGLLEGGHTAAALAALSGTTGERERELRTRLVGHWSRADLSGLVAAVENEPVFAESASLRSAALRGIAQRMILEDPTSALEWIRRLPEAEDPGRLMSSAIGSLGNLDPATAARLLPDIDNTMARKHGASVVAYKICRDGRYGAALEWSAEVSDEAAPELAVEVLERWLRDEKPDRGAIEAELAGIQAPATVIAEWDRILARNYGGTPGR